MNDYNEFIENSIQKVDKMEALRRIIELLNEDHPEYKEMLEQFGGSSKKRNMLF